MNHDALFFARLLQDRDPSKLRMVRREDLDEGWQGVYDFILQHAQASGALPHTETVELSCRVMLGNAPEDAAFYAKRIRDNAMRRVMEEGFEEQVVKPLAGQEAHKALDGAAAVVSQVRREFRADTSTLLDYNANTNVRLADYELRAKAQDVLGLPTRFDSLTRATGGYMPGEAWAIAGRPNQGKSWLACIEAVTLYQRGARVLLVSMETPAQNKLPRDATHRVVQGQCLRCRLVGVEAGQACPAAQVNRQRLSIRLDALGAGVSAWRLLKGNLTPREKERFQAYLGVVADPAAGGYGWGDLRVVAPPDVRNLADLELEVMSYQPDIVIWDSAYLGVDFSTSTKRKDAFDELLIGFKLMLEREGIAGVLTWHFKREVTEKATSAGLGDTAYTDELGRLMDVVVGLFRPPERVQAREAIYRTLKVRDGIRMPELLLSWAVKEKGLITEIREEPAEAA